MEEKELSKSSIWIEAIRLRTLPLSVAGILTGSALAFRIGAFKMNVMIPAIATTLLLQILSNLSNDYGDAEKGTDGANRIGPKRMVQSGHLKTGEIKSGIYLAAFLALVSGIFLLHNAFGPDNIVYALSFFVLGIFAIWAAIKYTVGKNAYGYSGLGDIFVLLFFGFVSVAGSFTLFTHALSISALLQSATIGCFSAGVLHLNNMRDRESDSTSGKHTIAVKLGYSKSKIYFYFLISTGIFCSILDASLTTLHFSELTHMLALFPILWIIKKVSNNTTLEGFNNYLKPLALSTFFYSLLLFISFIV